MNLRSIFSSFYDQIFPYLILAAILVALAFLLLTGIYLYDWLETIGEEKVSRIAYVIALIVLVMAYIDQERKNSAKFANLQKQIEVLSDRISQK